MDKKREISATEQERIELAQKLTDWVNENPTESLCLHSWKWGHHFSNSGWKPQTLC